MTILDENKVLGVLPKYVASGPDSMPSTRLYEGDFGVLLATIKRMSGRLDAFGSVLSAISRDVYALQAKAKATVVNTKSTGVLNLDHLQVWLGLPVHQPVSDTTRVVSDVTSRGNSVVTAVPAKASDVAVSTTTANDVTGYSASCPLERTETQWALLASMPQPSSNRYAALATIDGDEYNNSDRPFVSSRAQKRSVAKHLQQSKIFMMIINLDSPVVNQNASRLSSIANQIVKGNKSLVSHLLCHYLFGRQKEQ